MSQAILAWLMCQVVWWQLDSEDREGKALSQAFCSPDLCVWMVVR